MSCNTNTTAAKPKSSAENRSNRIVCFQGRVSFTHQIIKRIQQTVDFLLKMQFIALIVVKICMVTQNVQAIWPVLHTLSNNKQSTGSMAGGSGSSSSSSVEYSSRTPSLKWRIRRGTFCFFFFSPDSSRATLLKCTRSSWNQTAHLVRYVQLFEPHFHSCHHIRAFWQYFFKISCKNI